MFSGLKWTITRQSGRSKREQSSVRIKSGRSFWIFPAWKWEVQNFGGKTVHFRPYWFFNKMIFEISYVSFFEVHLAWIHLEQPFQTAFPIWFFPVYLSVLYYCQDRQYLLWLFYRYFSGINGPFIGLNGPVLPETAQIPSYWLKQDMVLVIQAFESLACHWKILECILSDLVHLILDQ